LITLVQDIDVASIKDCEDSAVGSGILSQNAVLFDDKSQVCQQHEVGEL
jgi:hypothetical protein